MMWHCDRCQGDLMKLYGITQEKKKKKKNKLAEF